MAEKSNPVINDIVRRPLYVYDLPVEILSTLRPRGLDTEAIAADTDTPAVRDRQQPDTENAVSTSMSCAMCQSHFASVIDQRDHVRSDFHKYNLKLKLKDLPTLDESTFIKAVGDLDESISGSESSSEEDGEADANTDDSTLAALLRRQAKVSDLQTEHSSSKTIRGPGKPPLLWLTSPSLPENTFLGVYSAILSDVEQEEAGRHLVDILKRKQLKPIPAKNSSNNTANLAPSNALPHFFLCMVGGGHFAAMIVALAPEIMKKAGGVEERHARVLAHKTFHRYTTRRKQGGAQSANDNAKGNAHSAGSSLRRYNEAALETDIRSILSEWRDMIDSSELLFIRATGTTNRRTLFGPYDGQVLRNNDPRNRGFPFSTRRATQVELMRSFTELTRLKVSIIVEQQSKEESVPTTPSKPATPRQSTPIPKLSPEQEALQMHSTQITALIRRSKAPALLSYLSNNSLSPSLTLFPPNHHAPTPLHQAASSNSPALVLALLTKVKPIGADPASLNGDGKSPFDLSGNLQTRNAFRIARSMLGEEAWDWHAAHVPSAMTQGQADERQERDRVTKQQDETQRRKADLDKLNREEAEQQLHKTEKKAGKGQTLGAMPQKTAAEVREEEARGLTPEMKTRLEREKRARAAEQRLQRM